MKLRRAFLYTVILFSGFMIACGDANTTQTGGNNNQPAVEKKNQEQINEEKPVKELIAEESQQETQAETEVKDTVPADVKIPTEETEIAKGNTYTGTLKEMYATQTGMMFTFENSDGEFYVGDVYDKASDIIDFTSPDDFVGKTYIFEYEVYEDVPDNFVIVSIEEVK